MEEDSNNSHSSNDRNNSMECDDTLTAKITNKVLWQNNTVNKQTCKQKQNKTKIK